MSHKLTARQLGSILFLQRALPVTLTFPMMIGMQSSHGVVDSRGLGYSHLPASAGVDGVRCQGRKGLMTLSNIAPAVLGRL